MVKNSQNFTFWKPQKKCNSTVDAIPHFPFVQFNPTPPLTQHQLMGEGVKNVCVKYTIGTLCLKIARVFSLGYLENTQVSGQF